MKSVLVILFLGIGIISCHTSKKISADAAVTESGKPSRLEGNWQLQMLFASDSSWSKVPSINFNINEKTFSGNSGCNIIRGKFTISESYLGFDKNILSTKMACQGNYEKTFLAALLKINKFSISKDELELGQGEIVLMKFKKI